ncbi:MAG: transcription elongation factor GreA [Chthonomonadales bacterium]|nr:transcription elongation factor GreA [Chthonomonadales bacterium]
MLEDDTILLTPEGYARLEKELERLRTTDRREVADRMREAQNAGEFAENAEYEEAKTEQAMLETRIRELRRTLQRAEILTPEMVPTDRVATGSVVTLKEAGTGDIWKVTIVGSIEADPDSDLVSDESPLGQAIIGRTVGDRVTVTVPAGKLRYKITHISR